MKAEAAATVRPHPSRPAIQSSYLEARFPTLGSQWEKNTRALLKSTARSFYLSLQFLPSRVGSPLGLAYLLARATDTIADSSNSPLSERLCALEALKNLVVSIKPANGDHQTPAEIKNHASSLLKNITAANNAERKLLQETPSLLAVFSTLPPTLQSHTSQVLQTIIEAQRLDIVRFGYASEDAPHALQSSDDTVAYTYAVAGCVGEFWTNVCHAQIPNYALVPIELLLEHGRLLGQGLQLVNILRDLPADLREGRCYLPAQELESHGIVPSQLIREPRNARELVHSWINQARTWIAHGAQYAQGIRGRRLRFSVSLPRLIAEQTLSLLEKNPPLETPRRLRIPRAMVYRCALAAAAESMEPVGKARMQFDSVNNANSANA